MKSSDLIKAVRAGALALVLSVLPLTATVFAQTNTNNTNTVTTRDDDRSDYDWLGWLGLLGLLGLIPRKRQDVHVRSNAPADPRR